MPSCFSPRRLLVELLYVPQFESSGYLIIEGDDSRCVLSTDDNLIRLEVPSGHFEDGKGDVECREKVDDATGLSRGGRTLKRPSGCRTALTEYN